LAAFPGEVAMSCLPSAQGRTRYRQRVHGAGHILAVEAKSGANLEPQQGQRLTELTPELLIVAGGITVANPVPLHCEVLYACLAEHADRMALGADEASLRVPILAVSKTIPFS
jgi:hypothetical protein